MIEIRHLKSGSLDHLWDVLSDDLAANSASDLIKETKEDFGSEDIFSDEFNLIALESIRTAEGAGDRAVSGNAHNEQPVFNSEFTKFLHRVGNIIKSVIFAQVRVYHLPIYAALTAFLFLTSNLTDQHFKTSPTVVASGSVVYRGVDNDNITNANILLSKSIIENGKSAYALGDYERSFQIFDKAVNLAPAFSEPYIERGKALAKIGDNERAIEDFSKALDLKEKDDGHEIVSPETEQIYVERAKSYFKLVQMVNAISDFSKVIDADPAETSFRIDRSISYFLLKDNIDAIGGYASVLYIDSGSVFALNDRGYLYQSSYELTKAIADFDSALKLERLPMALKNRGLAYLMVGKYDQAIADLNATLEIDPNFVDALVGRALARKQIGNNVDALADMTKAVGLKEADAPLENYIIQEGAINLDFKNRQVLSSYLDGPSLCGVNVSNGDLCNSKNVKK